MKAAVINMSYPHYNLGACKLSDWLRSQSYEVAEQGCGDVDLVCLSAIFSWDVPKAVKIALHYKGRAEIWAGGPGFFRLGDYWRQVTGLEAHKGLDQRFEKQRGSYRMTFAARGCPVGCHFCIVPQLEGKVFTLDWDFQPAPILCDNNVSALPVAFQEHIISRYIATGTRLLDANSGFEPRAFDEGTYQRWKPILKGPWRYAFDIMPEWRDVERVSRILKDEPPSKKRVYVLVGNEPFESCYERAQKVIELGCEPHCQYEMALDTLTKTPRVRFDWTDQKLTDFCRYYNTWGWRTYKLTEYKPRLHEVAPFNKIRGDQPCQK